MIEAFTGWRSHRLYLFVKVNELYLQAINIVYPIVRYNTLSLVYIVNLFKGKKGGLTPALIKLQAQVGQLILGSHFTVANCSLFGLGIFDHGLTNGDKGFRLAPETLARD